MSECDVCGFVTFFYFIDLFVKKLKWLKMVVRSRVKGTEFGLWNFDVKFFVAIIDLVKSCVCE
jgi:hypothetical protein